MLMREHHVGAVVVTETVGEGLRVAGLLTDRDLAIEVIARGGSASGAKAGSLGRGELASVGEDAGLAEAVDRMRSAGVRRLLVHDAQGQLAGLVSFDDLLPACLGPLSGLADVLRKGIEREVVERGAIAAPPRPVVHVPAMGTAGWAMR